jgi:hypothetical protein
MSKIEIIAGNFDLQKMGRLCNHPGCSRKPSRRVSVFDEDRVTGERKPIATVFLCSEHEETSLPAFLNEINQVKELGRIVTTSVHDIGYVTY